MIRPRGLERLAMDRIERRLSAILAADVVGYSRLMGIAEAGGICVSARVQEDAAGRIDFAFEDMGEQALKNIARPVRAFRLRFLQPALPGGAVQPSSPDKPSIAVLPFHNMSGDPEQEY